ncbi:unnamed protein product [Rotaria sp. Silwood1]|nr:unnamed protein product [Rotaria sp. Silwood1]
MSDLIIEPQSSSVYGVAPPISDEAMDAKRKALEILVAKPEHDRIPVPNHLLQSKLFVKLKRNKLVEVTPHEIHFDGFEINQIQTRELHILNRSSEVLRVDIIPPQTSVFQIDYKKPQRLVPGFSIHVKIIFKPTQWQYYHDAIRIHTPERDHHIITPIHAYPIILLDGILPNSYQFANTPIGQVITKTFSFQSSAPVEFQYRIEILSQDPALTIEPMEGTINQLNVTNITVTYAPTAFCTSRLSVAIIVSQFHIQPFLCTFIGKCLPGLARELAKKTLGMSGQFSTDNINLVVKKTASTMPSITKQKITKQQQITESIIDNEIERDGLRIPKKIDSTWAVSKVLLQKKGKVALKDLRRLNELATDNQRGLNRQKKETIFLQDVSRIEDEEQRNKIRWQTKLGFDPLSHIERENILASRQISWDEYSIRIGHPIPDDEYIRDTVKYSEQRTIRLLDMNPTPGIMTYETPLPYSAIDVDSAICPIPLLERPGYSLTNRYLDREDIIQGTMTWKNMNSTGLSALTQVPTMSNVWLPRWNDPFSEDILPTNLPSFLHEMPASDRNQLLDNEMNEETKLILTPEMIRAEFLEAHMEAISNVKQDAMFKRKKSMVSSLNAFPFGDKLPESNTLLSIYGRESRARREQELDYFQRKKFGQLSDKVNKRIEKYHMASRTDLSLLSDQQQQQQIQPQPLQQQQQQQTILTEPSQ